MAGTSSDAILAPSPPAARDSDGADDDYRDAYGVAAFMVSGRTFWGEWGGDSVASGLRLAI